MSNLLNANIDSGLMHSIGMIYLPYPTSYNSMCKYNLVYVLL